MRKGKLFYCIAAIGFLYSCNRQPNSLPKPHTPRNHTVAHNGDTAAQIGQIMCNELTPPVHENVLTGGYLFVRQSQYSYNSPRFNPSNSNEIIYVLGDYINNTTTMIKYNLVTKIKITLASGIWGHPDWNMKGWIIFNRNDDQIWKVKDNGDSLIQLTTQGAYDGISDHPGNRLCFNTYTATMYSYISNENALIIDSLHYPATIYHGSWSPDNSKIAAGVHSPTGSAGGVGYIDMISKQPIVIYSGIAVQNGTNGVDWFPDSQTILWCSEKGVFKTNITTGSTIQIKWGCTSRTYLWPSVSSDVSKIIIQRYDYKAVIDTIFAEGNLYIMNADGSNETKIEF